MEAAVEALVRLRPGDKQQMDRCTAIERELSLIEVHEKPLLDAICKGDRSTKPETRRRARLLTRWMKTGSLPASVYKKRCMINTSTSPY